jgi:Tol biopolymer transport system component
MNSDGSNEIQISFDGAVYATWSPDGSKIAFPWGEDGVAYIRIVNADGSNPVNAYPSEEVYYRSLKWSPDGTRIVFSSASGRPDEEDIFTISLNGGLVKRLTAVGDNGSPSWSPDGSQITFMTNRDGFDMDKYEIYVMDADGSDQQNVSQYLPSTDMFPSWSK